MKISVLTALCCLVLAAPLHAGQVYKWVDAQGNVHYSDKPHRGAKRIKIAPPQSYDAPAALPRAQQAQPSAEGNPAAAPAPHQSISISSPKPQQSLWNVHNLTVSVNVTPKLGPGDSVTFSLDGKAQAPVSDTSVIFKDVTRGQHTVTATLNTARGAQLSASPVTFFIHQTSIKHRKPPL